jgi:LysM repeat protein
MARSYVIQKRDTLQKIAKSFFGDSELFKKLAEYNGIRNPDLIVVGQTIEIPSRSELEGVRPEIPAPAPGLVPPNGLNEILVTFGNIFEFIRDDGTLDPRWEVEQLARAQLPYSIPLSWDRTKSVSKLYCHKKLIGIFPAVFAEIEKQGLKDQVKTFGGCFNFRSKRTSGKISTHSWGVALDLNPETNQQGTAGDMHPGVVDVFRQFGFKWGGDWSGKSKDPMHFQFCTGY